MSKAKVKIYQPNLAGLPKCHFICRKEVSQHNIYSPLSLVIHSTKSFPLLFKSHPMTRDQIHRPKNFSPRNFSYLSFLSQNSFQFVSCTVVAVTYQVVGFSLFCENGKMWWPSTELLYCCSMYRGRRMDVFSHWRARSNWRTAAQLQLRSSSGRLSFVYGCI